MWTSTDGTTWTEGVIETVGTALEKADIHASVLGRAKHIVSRVGIGCGSDYPDISPGYAARADKIFGLYPYKCAGYYLFGKSV